MTVRSGEDAIEYFDQESAQWSHKYRRPNFQSRLATVSELVRAHPDGLEVLDYGCGSGVVALMLAEHGHRVTGVDASPQMIHEARELLMRRGVPAEQFQLEAVTTDGRGDYLEGTYDGVICTGVIEYLEQPFVLLQSLAERLTPNGFMILSFPNTRSLLRLGEALLFRFTSRLGRIGELTRIPTRYDHLRYQRSRPSLGEIRGFLEDQGLRMAAARHTAAKGVLNRWEGSVLIGMTTVAEFRRQAPAG
jgi:SAM-dependent methyltransferase